MVPPYSPAICPPKTPPSLEKESPLLHREKNGFLKGLYFGISTRTALESPKSDIFQIWPKRVLGHVISCPEPKFEKRIPMGSVSNERKEILMRDPIRWFKCKLKPPKKVPYNSQMTLHENCQPFVPQTDDLCFGPPTATYSNGHSSKNTQRGIFFNFRWTESDTLAPSCKFLGQNSEYPALQKLSNFSICPKISKSRHLTAYEMANQSHIQKCKPRCLGHPRLHLWTDAWWNWSMPSTL